MEQRRGARTSHPCMPARWTRRWTFALLALVVVALGASPALAQTDPCGGRGARMRFAAAADGGLTGSYVHQGGRDDLDAYTWHVIARWRVSIASHAELVALQRDAHDDRSTMIYVTCADGSYAPMFDDAFVDDVTTSTVTTSAQGARWPDLVQHVHGVWPTELTLRYDGSRARYAPIASAACPDVASADMLGDVYGPQLDSHLVLAPGLRVDASATLPEEAFRVTLASDPDVIVVGTLTGDRDGTVIALAPSTDGARCVVNVWRWSFGGNGVELRDPDATIGEGRAISEVVVHDTAGAYSLVLVRMAGMFHGGCDDGCEDARNWVVLAIDRTRMSISAPTDDASFSHATDSRATLRATSAGATLRVRGRAWSLDRERRVFVRARSATPTATR